MPSEGYKFFIEKLLKTIRDDVADCVEKSYERIKPDDIGKMLYLSDTSEILNYCKKVSELFDFLKFLFIFILFL